MDLGSRDVALRGLRRFGLNVEWIYRGSGVGHDEIRGFSFDFPVSSAHATLACSGPTATSDMAGCVPPCDPYIRNQALMCLLEVTQADVIAHRLE